MGFGKLTVKAMGHKDFGILKSGFRFESQDGGSLAKEAILDTEIDLIWRNKIKEETHFDRQIGLL